MSQWRSLSEDGIRALADALSAAGPLLRRASGQEAARVLGWPVVNTVLSFSVVADTGTGVGGSGNVDLVVRDGVVTSIIAAVTDALPKTREADAFIRDAFAAATKVVSEAFGAPAERVPGERPMVAWRLDDVSLELRLGLGRVTLGIQPNSDVDALAAQDEEEW